MDRDRRRRDDLSDDLPKLYEIFSCEVATIQAYGVFVRIPGYKKNGLVHKSQMANTRVEDPSDIVEPRDKVYCKVINIESESGKIGMSMKVVNQSTGQDLDPGHVQTSLDEQRRKTGHVRDIKGIELGAVLDTTCKQCGGKGHLKKDCFNIPGSRTYDLLPSLEYMEQQNVEEGRKEAEKKKLKKAAKKEKKRLKKEKKKEKKKLKKMKKRRKVSSSESSDSDSEDEKSKKRKHKEKKKRKKSKHVSSSDSSSDSSDDSTDSEQDSRSPKKHRKHSDSFREYQHISMHQGSKDHRMSIQDHQESYRDGNSAQPNRSRRLSGETVRRIQVGDGNRPETTRSKWESRERSRSTSPSKRRSSNEISRHRPEGFKDRKQSYEDPADRRRSYESSEHPRPSHQDRHGDRDATRSNRRSSYEDSRAHEGTKRGYDDGRSGDGRYKETDSHRDPRSKYDRH